MTYVPININQHKSTLSPETTPVTLQNAHRLPILWRSIHAIRKDQGAQLVFAAIAVKYIKDPSTQEFPAVRWELGWLRLSQAGFKAIGELTQEEEKPHQFDVAMRNKESGIGYTYTRPSQKARFRQSAELQAEVFDEAKKFADGAFLKKQLGEVVTALDMKAILSGNAAAGAGKAAQKHVDNTDEL